jgi:epoxyqueuosine reductase QueG
VNAFLESNANDLHLPDRSEPAFGAALLGFAAGADPLWNDYKKYVGEFHWTPAEAFALAFPEESARPDELTVISWILPQTSATRADQRKQKSMPSERWARARIMGENLVNTGLRRHLVEQMASAGVRAVAPSLLAQWSVRSSEQYVFSSNWSERHAAYAAGLGTFGLCDGLITPVGKAMRTGAVVARLRLPAAPRPYASHQEYCLFFSSGICGKCIKRCPAGAISPSGHNKRLCSEYLDSTVPYVRENYNFDGYGCGFCQVGVPCERGIPAVKTNYAGRSSARGIPSETA